VFNTLIDKVELTGEIIEGSGWGKILAHSVGNSNFKFSTKNNLTCKMYRQKHHLKFSKIYKSKGKEAGQYYQPT
jgi:hypothetical protein